MQCRLPDHPRVQRQPSGSLTDDDRRQGAKQYWPIWRASNKNKWSENVDEKATLQSCQPVHFTLSTSPTWTTDEMMNCFNFPTTSKYTACTYKHIITKYLKNALTSEDSKALDCTTYNKKQRMHQKTKPLVPSASRDYRRTAGNRSPTANPAPNTYHTLAKYCVIRTLYSEVVVLVLASHDKN